MVKRFLIVMGVCVAMLISASMFYANPVFAEPEAYHVGCAFAVTGKASWLGEPERNTVLMIAKQINDAGGINGHPLVLHIEDTQGDNTRAVNAMKKLIKKDKVCAIIGPSRSGTSMAAVPVVTQSEIPMISCASAAVITTPVEQRKWVFKVGPDDSDAARNIFAHMNAHDISQVGILTGTTGFGAAGREQLKELAKDYGIEIIADETYNPTDTDMTAQLISIRKTGAQAVINWSIVPAQSIVSKNMQQLKMTIPFTRVMDLPISNMPRQPVTPLKAAFFRPEESWPWIPWRMIILRKKSSKNTNRRMRLPIMTMSAPLGDMPMMPCGSL